ncbi:type VI-B CRISPR accessory protein Csx27, partial [Macellibacteroides fermentans]|uniref:type VI-B CRISPR accessory protein Csx27 n=1 Tax=Macellibacteroides fermentans TaxID=879969 RepID=UPI00406D07D0
GDESESDKEELDLLCKLREDFYDRMYYTLELSKNNEHPKTFQSFYFFFRQLVLACFILLLLSLVLYGLSCLNALSLSKPDWGSLTAFASLIILILITSIILARWYRKRMVEKMYWFFYIYINQVTSVH